MTTKNEKTEALKNLKSWIKEGDKIYYIVRQVSTSGMYRHIGFYKFDTDEKGEIIKYHLSYNMAKALDYPFKHKSCSVGVSGCGMDMGFHLVYTLSSVLYDDGYAIKHSWL